MSIGLPGARPFRVKSDESAPDRKPYQGKGGDASVNDRVEIVRVN